MLEVLHAAVIAGVLGIFYVMTIGPEGFIDADEAGSPRDPDRDNDAN
jgi:hypothetical protein